MSGSKKTKRKKGGTLYVFFSVFVLEMNSFYNNGIYDIVRIINTPS